ncbi:MAG: DoxX family protein [Polyangiaceae bacterium]|nr:DoxX family protein [Polyangiaceae bacterium]
MHIGLWVAQVLLALVFLGAGLLKSFTPVAELQTKMAWIKDGMDPLVRFIGVTEVLGALGMILPTATRIKPWLTPLAAVGLALTMVLAAMTHWQLGEYPGIVTNVVLGGLAAFVAWGRFGKAKVPAR